MYGIIVLILRTLLLKPVCFHRLDDLHHLAGTAHQPAWITQAHSNPATAHGRGGRCSIHCTEVCWDATPTVNFQLVDETVSGRLARLSTTQPVVG